MALVGHKNRKDHRPGADVPRETIDDEPVEPVDAETEIAPVEDTVNEVAPHKPRLMDRIRSRRGRGRGGHAPSPVPGERPPKRRKPTGRRVTLDSDISDVWAFGGRRLEHTAHYPTGRMLQYQAPAAGIIIDRALAGTLPDRVLFQPLARNRDKYEDVGFLLAGPLLTFSITATMQQMQAAIDSGDKELYDSLVPKLEMQREMFTWTLTMMLPRLAAGKKAAEEKKAKADKVIAEAFPELGGENPVDMLADSLFRPPSYQEGPSNNGRTDHATAAPSEQGSVPF